MILGETRSHDPFRCLKFNSATAIISRFQNISQRAGPVAKHLIGHLLVSTLTEPKGPTNHFTILTAEGLQ